MDPDLVLLKIDSVNTVPNEQQHRSFDSVQFEHFEVMHQNLPALNFEERCANEKQAEIITLTRPEASELVDATLNIEPFHCETTLTISREGWRQSRRNNESTFMNRVRKTEEQTRYLIAMFDSTKGRIPKSLRDRAERATGLSWIQIYKWIFDRRQREKDFNVYRLLNYPVPIFRVTNRHGKDITVRRPVFKVERPARTAMRASGKPGTR